MKYISFTHLSAHPRVGVLLGSAVIDVSAAYPLVFEDSDDADSCVGLAYGILKRISMLS